VEALKNRYRKAILIWVAMFFGIFIYTAVVEFLRTNPAFLERPSPFREADPLRYFFLFLAVAELFLIGFIRNQIVPGKPTRKKEGNGSPIPSMGSRLLSSSIVTNALCESVAICGLLLFFLTRNPFDFYIFLVLSLTGFAFYFPRYAQWAESVREGEKEESLRMFVRS
jgi:hypothetical protein